MSLPYLNINRDTSDTVKRITQHYEISFNINAPQSPYINCIYRMVC
ncbi:hypothetical Protein YC6258_04266 [Gynuella sunshinyii YC6258]|uniref:Uncharacterized protein n=1 Tax=Gynuella sunshinyii YC6258 TaxID=1445510 RepID=A0A0C5VAF9_9GAMM|nr:hypothetical Protein YC6258_04266 [Gynuella sunshinyii YC6258]